MTLAVRTFRDLDLNFTRHPATNDVATRIGDQSIIRSLRNLINMNRYDVSISFFILNQTSPTTITVFLERVR